LHPKTIIPAMNKNIPVRVLNTYNVDGEGTVILKEAGKSDKTVKAITAKKNVIVLNITSSRMLDAHGFLAKIFTIFAKNNKSVDMISTSEVSVSLTIDNDKDLDKIEKQLGKIAYVRVEKEKAIISLIGEGMKCTYGLAGKIFTALGNHKINIDMISQGASEINVGFVVDSAAADKVVKLLHEEVFG